MIWTFAVLFGLHILLFGRIATLKKQNSTGDILYSVLIPARNEEDNLLTLLPTIMNQPLVKEVIVINDGSTDSTREVALAFEAVVVDTEELPEKWMGKSFALWTGVKHAKADHLLFLDADTWAKPNALEKIDTAFRAQHYKGSISIQPYHETRTWKERFSLVFHFVTAAATGSTHLLRTKDGTIGGYGQVMAIHKSTYYAVGGHEAIKEEVVENLALTQKIKAHHFPVQAFTGKNVISMRMYPNGLSDLVNGWTKSFAKGAMMTNPVLLFLISIWLTFYFTALLDVVNVTTINMWLAGMGVYSIFFIWSAAKFGVVKWIDVFFVPLYFLAFLCIFSRSVLFSVTKRKTTWKDRTISGGNR